MIDLLGLFIAWTGLPDAPATREAMSKWEFFPYRSGFDPVALAGLNGTEIHFAIHPDWRHRVIARRRTQDFLRPLLDRRGYLTTRALKGSCSRFLVGLGFAHTQTSELFDHYMLTDLPWSKRVTGKDVLMIRSSPSSGAELARHLGVNVTTVCKARRGETHSTTLGIAPAKEN